MANPLRKILNDRDKLWGNIAKAGNIGVDVRSSHIVFEKRNQTSPLRPILKSFIIRLKPRPFVDFHKPLDFILISGSSTHDSIRLMPERPVRVEQAGENRTWLRIRTRR